MPTGRYIGRGETVFVDVQVHDKCWNLIDSYGMICVGCGCCSNDKQTRYKSRIKTLEAWLEEQYNFDMWDDEYGLRKIQEKNIKSNIRSFKRMLRYYKGKLKEMEVSGDA